jgi:hypothetical protein
MNLPKMGYPLTPLSDNAKKRAFLYALKPHAYIEKREISTMNAAETKSSAGCRKKYCQIFVSLLIVLNFAF